MEKLVSRESCFIRKTFRS